MTCPQPAGPFSIFTGDAKTMPLRLAYANGLPVDLTICTEIVCNLQNADGSITQRKLSTSQITITSPPTTGQFIVSLPSVVSALLQIGELQDFDVTFTIGGSPFTVRFYQALSVFETE